MCYRDNQPVNFILTIASCCGNGEAQLLLGDRMHVAEKSVTYLLVKNCKGASQKMGERYQLKL